MADANDSCCSPEPTPNPTEFGAPRAELAAGQPPRHLVSVRQLGRVMLGAAAGVVLLVAAFPAWSGLILGGVKSNASCCSLTNGVAASPKQVAIVVDSCCLPPGGSADTAKAGPSPADGPTGASASKDGPTRNAVFKVQGLECPAVPGLGCGHRLAPELARIDKLKGVERSFANRTGTMVRVSVADAADREKVAGEVSKFLTDNKRAPVQLAGDELQRAIDKEEWRETNRISELSAFEFRTLALGRVREFAGAEKLDAKLTGELLRLAEEEWDRTAGKAVEDVKPGSYAKDWSARCTRFATSFVERTKGLLTAEQHARLKEQASCCCPADERPNPTGK